MEIPLLKDLVIIFSFSTIVLYLFHRFRVPAIVGLLLTGIVVGPYGLGLANAVHQVETLAEIGVVLLLFTIGVEFSLETLLRIQRYFLLGGSLKGVLTYVAGFLMAKRIGLPVGRAIFLGFLISFSSAAISYLALRI